MRIRNDFILLHPPERVNYGRLDILDITEGRSALGLKSPA